MMSIIGTIVVVILVLQTMFAWFFHLINGSDKPETPLEWAQWSCLYFTIKYFVNTGEDEE